MWRYLLKRALSAVIALFLFVSLMFFITEIMIPGDFSTQFSEFLSRQQRAELQAALGLDFPLGVRYLRWLRNLSHGNLGMSLYGSMVTDALLGVLPYTMLVFFLGTLIAFQLGQWLGRLVTWPVRSTCPALTSARRYLASGVTLSAVMFYTSFPPWLAFLVMHFFSRRLTLARRDMRPWLLGVSRSVFTEMWPYTSVAPETVMWWIVGTFVAVWAVLGWASALLERRVHRRIPFWLQAPLFAGLLVGSWYVLGFGPLAMKVMTVAATPLITYVLLSFGETLLIMRTSLTDTLREDYVTTARAKGLPESVVRDRHAARTALLPVLSRFVVSFPYMLTGVVIIEDILNWPGISNSLFDSLYNQDMPMVMGALLFVGVISAIARLFLDVLYVFLDPRIRYDRGHLRRAA